MNTMLFVNAIGFSETFFCSFFVLKLADETNSIKNVKSTTTAKNLFLIYNSVYTINIFIFLLNISMSFGLNKVE